MDKIKEAFQKIKEDINSLSDAIISLSYEVDYIKQNSSKPSKSNIYNNLNDFIYIPSNKFSTYYSNFNSTDNTSIYSLNTVQTDNQTDNSTHKMPLEGLKDQNEGISIRNNGVQTDRQTIRQTDQQTNLGLKPAGISSNNTISNDSNSLKSASEIINSIDGLKSDLTYRFKSLTSQEMTVFSALYSLDEAENSEITYKSLSEKLSLTESTIRDYINKLISKEIPLIKIKQNNKKIYLKIDPNFKKITTLSSILSLKDT